MHKLLVTLTRKNVIEFPLNTHQLSLGFCGSLLPRPLLKHPPGKGGVGKENFTMMLLHVLAR